MKANELMIGDWVYDTILKGNTKVEILSMSGIRGDFHENVWDEQTFEPIPLTTEILERNFPDPDDGVVWWKNDEPFYHIECLPLNGTRTIIPFAQYVHQLQHAMRLCGIEKEIELS